MLFIVVLVFYFYSAANCLPQMKCSHAIHTHTQAKKKKCENKSQSIKEQIEPDKKKLAEGKKKW